MPNALREMLNRDHDAASENPFAAPNELPLLRSYQRDAGVERAIAERKRHMLVAMATGTGKTFTLVNQTYLLPKLVPASYLTDPKPGHALSLLPIRSATQMRRLRQSVLPFQRVKRSRPQLVYIALHSRLQTS